MYTVISINGNADSNNFNFVVAWMVLSCILDTGHVYGDLREFITY